MKPIIGIITRPELSTGKNEVMVIYKNLINAIASSGGIPIGITPTDLQTYYGKDITNTKKTNFKDMKKMIDMCDGIILQGGDDFYDYDLKVIEYCYKIDKPTLGICLGMQTMGYKFNGELIEITNHNFKGKKYVHKINLKNNSKLFSILSKTNFMVNSHHSYALNKTDLSISANSSDGTIEAIEDKNKRFFIGIQWHPESMIEYDELSKKLFKKYIKTCKKDN